MTPKVLIIELGDSHNEVLFTQVEAFKEANISIAFALNEKLKDRIHPKVIQDTPPQYFKVGGHFQHLKNALCIRRKIKKEGITHIVMNTASGNAIRLLSLFLPQHVQVTGILHNACKLEKSKSQRFISKRVKHYLVLADQLIPASPKYQDLQLEAFYPILFPFDKKPTASQHERFHIIIPGNVSNARRDYKGLITLWQNLTDEEKELVTFEILGNINKEDGPALKALLQDKELADAFILHESFVEEDLFYERVANSDAILPLLHPGISDFESYKNCKISGGFNLAYGFQKPLLMHESFQKIEDFKNTSILYTLPKLPSLEEMKTASVRIKNYYAQENKFSPKAQKQRYLDFVLRA